MVKVIIGVDPHKGSHTAIAIDPYEQQLGQIQVRATRRQVEQLLGWASEFGERTWAVESAGGLGYLLAQKLLAAGETVVDVPATLGARVRVLANNTVDEDRRERCVIDRDRRVARPQGGGGPSCGSCDGVAAPRRTGIVI